MHARRSRHCAHAAYTVSPECIQTLNTNPKPCPHSQGGSTAQHSDAAHQHSQVARPATSDRAARQYRVHHDSCNCYPASGCTRSAYCGMPAHDVIRTVGVPDHHLNQPLSCINNAKTSTNLPVATQCCTLSQEAQWGDLHLSTNAMPNFLTKSVFLYARHNANTSPLW